jgi:hypothetical protein
MNGAAFGPPLFYWTVRMAGIDLHETLRIWLEENKSKICGAFFDGDSLVHI